MIDQLNEQYDNLLADLQYFSESRQYSRAIAVIDELQQVSRELKELDVEQPF